MRFELQIKINMKNIKKVLKKTDIKRKLKNIYQPMGF